MRHTKLVALVLFAIIAALSVNPANATPVTVYGTVDITSHSSTYYSQAQLYGGGLNGGSYYTGVYSWTTGATTGLGAYVPTWGFCIELAQSDSTGISDVISLSDAPRPPQYGSPMGTTKADSICELWGRNFDPTWSTGGNPIAAQAFSFAIWEIVYENGPWDVTSGPGFSTTDLIEGAIANTWLSQLNGDTAYFANNLVAISSDTGQDYVVQLPEGHMIPEPATLSMLAVGAAALLRRRKS